MATNPSPISLSAPYTIFALSQPIHQTRAKDREGTAYRTCYTSPVENKKRRRTGNTEVAIAIDGEGVNIYDLRSTQLLSTHALPPTTKFSCASVSTATRISKTKLLRKTYAAISFPKKQIVCWEENDVRGGQDIELESTPITPLSRNNDYRHEVVHLYDLSTSGGTGLLVVYEDGCIRCLSADLEEELWDLRPSDLPSTGTPKKISTSPEVVYAITADLSTVRKTLLKSRPDVLIPGCGIEDTRESGDLVLFTVIHTSGRFQTRLFLIPTAQATGHNASELLVSDLSTVGGGQHSIFSLHLPSATLYQLSATYLTTFSLAPTVPTVVSSLRLPTGSDETYHMYSLLRISSSTVLVATHEYISLYDTKFSSLQARVPLHQNSTSSTVPSRDPSRASSPASGLDGKPKGQIFLTSYIQDLDLAVGYSQAGIIGVQLTRSDGKPGAKAGVRRSGLLIDSLCRGVEVIDMGISKKQMPVAPGSRKLLSRLASERQAVKKVLRDLKEAKKAGDLDKFEQTFAEYVGVSRKIGETEQGEDTLMANGTSDLEVVDKLSSMGNSVPEFVLEQDGSQSPNIYKPLRHEFVVGVLDMLFEASSDDNSVQRLSISFYPPNVFRYLIESGNFSETLIRSYNGLVQCLAEFDPSLRTLEWVLGVAGEIGLGEVVKAIEIGMKHGDMNIDDEDQIVLDVIRSEVMRLALVRLNGFPAEAITKALKTGLGGQHLMDLIHLLRKELLFGRQLHDEVGVGIGIEDVGIVADLLTVALDTVGIGGLVLGNSSDEFIQELRSEVTAVVEGVQEAAALKSILEEVLRHADWRKATIERKQADKKQAEKRKRAPKRVNANVRGSGNREAGKRKKGKRVEVNGLQNGELAEKEEEGGKMELALEYPAVPSKDAPSENSTEELANKPTGASPLSKQPSEEVQLQNEIGGIVVKRKREIPAKSLSVAKHLVNSGPIINADTSVVSPLLPLGVPPAPISRISLVTAHPAENGINFKELRQLNRRKIKEASYRESMVAGVYSVESMLV
ncbi:hypothetical protein L873DRAFT_1787081 [Choiromyces venosus 120613-1]|uniref:Uncharacterized protein n=1 Tax=Choiromyces venosus 120613-1 TaxID=1336337 RepID=A0A3N4JY39_9PEZI|nr:hypothetical protein L873DRAFT_1787081 [Choiromyces venosus 120613-1]